MLTLGQELRRLREALRLTQDQVAKAVGHAKPTHVSVWESDARRPSKANLIQLAKVLQTTPAHLHQFGQSYDPTAPRETRRQRAHHAARIDPADQLRALIKLRHAEILEKAGMSGLAFWVQLIDILEKHPDRERALLAALAGILDKLDAERKPDGNPQASGGRAAGGVA